MLGEPDTFREQVKLFVEDRYALDPTAATIAGIHEHDAKLADLSEAGFAARDSFSDRWLHVFESHDGRSWPAADRTDLALVVGELRGERALRPFERFRRQPSLYSDAITRGAYYALIREEGDVETRLGQLAERLEQAPAALRHAVANLDPERVPPVYVVVAGESATAGATFVRAILPSLAPAGSKAKAALTGAGKRAGDALDQYASWLRDDLMRRAKGSFAIGRDAFDTLLREKELVPYDAASLKQWGEELYAETASKLSEAAHALGDTEWRDSLERLRKDHPTADELVDTYRREMERSREATTVAGLATVPAGESLTVEAMPDFARPTLPYAAYVQPGPFERSRRGRFWVTLPAGDEPQTVKDERLSGHPRKGIAVIACHEGYPGHHLQLSTAADHPSIARRALRSNVFIEGWGLYVEELMTELGFLDDPETRLLRLKDLLWRAARVSVDVGLSTGELGFEQAVRFMMEGPQLERPNAVGECRRYTLNPLQPSSYALGRAAILRLRAKARTKGLGMRQFHDALLGCASIPPALAAAELDLAD
jgi:uncharacterized protein (DUF885 family)